MHSIIRRTCSISLVLSLPLLAAAPAAAQEAGAAEFQLREIRAQRMLVRNVTGTYDQHPQIIGELFTYLGGRGIAPSAPVVGIYHNDPAEVEENALRWQVGTAIDDEDFEVRPPYAIETLPATGAVVYETTIGELDGAGERAEQWAADKGLQTFRPVRMEFLDQNPDQRAMRVRVILPVKKMVIAPGNATLDDLAFIVGEWRGGREGNVMLERWSAPQGPSMLGAFQLLDARGRVQFYELLVMQQREDGIYWAVRHFSWDLEPWEGDPKWAKLTRLEKDRAIFTFEDESDRFKQIVFRVRGEDRLAVHLIPREGGEDAVAVFEFDRVK